MDSDSVSEPPPPPDIRPYGRSYHSQPNTYRSLRHDSAISSSPAVSDQRTKPTSRVPQSTLKLHHVVLLVAAVAIAFAPIVAAAAVTPSVRASVVGSFSADPTISSPVPHATHTRSASKMSAKSTPLLSLLAFLGRHALSAIQQVTGLDAPGAASRLPAAALGKRNVHDQPTSTTIAEAIVVPILIALSGMFAGLTLGYFSVDQTQLQVLSISGTRKQQEYAHKIMPVRKNSHLLLTTLILGNMIVNEALPVVSDPLFPDAIISVVFSTAAVVIFAEIIPQSVCSRYGLFIGAKMAPVVRVMMWVAFPLAWPIAKLLETILGAHHGIVYRRSELRELIKMHAATAEGGGDLDLDTVTMAQGALDLAGKSVKEAMTPIDKVFMLPITAKLDYETLGEVVKSGHSRIPVYQMVEVPDVNLAAPTKGPTPDKMVKRVIGSLLVKSCVLLDPEDATPLATIPINAIPSVPFDEPLTNMLNVFQEGRSHMAIVSRRGKRVENDPVDQESVMTAAAGGLRQKILRKVATIAHGSSGSDTDSSDSDTDVEKKGERRAKRKATKEAKEQHKSEVQASAKQLEQSQADQVKEAAQAETKKRSLLQQAKLHQYEQTVPADAQMPPEYVEKFFEGLEGAPLGIITLEDVLEELIGEEIYDEYDETGGPVNAASAFIPREAALAASKAALEREKALAESTPLPQTNDAELERPQPVAQPSRRLIPKIPTVMPSMPRFGLGKRPASQPGKTRPQASGTPVSALAPMSTPAAETPPVLSADAQQTAEPESMEGTTIHEPTVAGSKPPSRSTSAHMSRTQSETKLGGRSASQPGSHALDAAATGPPAVGTGGSPALGVGGMTPLTGIEPVSAVPARLLPGGPAPGGAATPVPGVSAADKTAAPTTSLLSEALMIERGRRRLAASGQDPNKALRVPSSSGAARAAQLQPSRQPTPPTASSTPVSAATGNVPAPVGPGAIRSQPVGAASLPGGAGAGAGVGAAVGGSQGVIHSPQPQLAGKKGARFKSVPTPIPTPAPRGDDPMEQAGRGAE